MSSREQTSLYLHELGHMVGLGHVRGDHIMATAGLDRHQFSKADLAGLYTLGRHGNDCVGGTDTAPGPVTNVQAIAQPDGSILVTWTPTGGWAATYDVMLWERGSSGGSGFGRRTTTPSYVITAEDLEDVNEGNTLSIEITGVNDIGEGTPVTIPIR
jgi:hypothetical protein